MAAGRFLVRLIHIGDAEACQANVMLMMDVSCFVFLFTYAHTARGSFKYIIYKNILPHSQVCSIFCLYITFKERMMMLFTEEAFNYSELEHLGINKLLFHDKE